MSISRAQAGFNPQSRQSNTDGTPVYVDGRVVGHVAGDLFTKAVRGSVHMLRKPRGWASDVAALREAMDGRGLHGIDRHGNGAVYRAAIADMLDRGLRFDRGFGAQVALPLDTWLASTWGKVSN